MAERSFTATWDDQHRLAEAGCTLSGLEHARAEVDGTLPKPSMLVLLGIDVLEVDVGHVIAVVTPGEQHYNLIGTVHGGLVATLLDTAMGLAFQTCAGVGERCTTLNLDVTFIRALREDSGEVRAAGRILHRGGRALTAQATATDATGRLLATGSATAIRIQLG